MAIEMHGRTNPSNEATARDPLAVVTAIFAVALVIHAADHFRRGMDVLEWPVFWAGNLQMLLAVVTIVLVARRHRLAPTMAVIVGFLSAFGFVVAHLTSSEELSAGWFAEVPPPPRMFVP